MAEANISETYGTTIEYWLQLNAMETAAPVGDNKKYSTFFIKN